MCRKIAVNQLTQKETAIIKKFVLDDNYKHWSLRSVYYRMIRDSKCHIHISTFYKYLSLLGLKTFKRVVKPTNYQSPIRALTPLEILHMDYTELRITPNIKVYIHIIADNFSRRPLGVKVGLNKTALLARDNLKYVDEKFLKDNQKTIIYSDGGGENKADTGLYMQANCNLEHRIAQTESWGSNSMIESIIKKIKQCFLYPNTYNDYEDFEQKLNEAINVYTYQMPLAAIGGRTPQEAFENINPFPEEVSSLIKQAAIKRKETNKHGNCF